MAPNLTVLHAIDLVDLSTAKSPRSNVGISIHGPASKIPTIPAFSRGRFTSVGKMSWLSGPRIPWSVNRREGPASTISRFVKTARLCAGLSWPAVQTIGASPIELTMVSELMRQILYGLLALGRGFLTWWASPSGVTSHTPPLPANSQPSGTTSPVMISTDKPLTVCASPPSTNAANPWPAIRTRP